MPMRSFALVIALLATTVPVRAESVVEIAAGRHDRADMPIVVPLPESLRGAKGLAMTCLENGKSVDAQILLGNEPSAVWMLEQPLRAGATRRYRLAEVAAEQVGPPRVRCEDDGRQLMLRVGDRPVLNYHHRTVESPSGIDPLYRRSGHIHPLFTPSGRSVTDDFPPDHAHQHGIFFAWVNTTFAGHAVDFWNQMGRTGAIEHIAIESLVDGPVFGQFRVRLRHLDTTSAGNPRAVLDETWDVRAYNLDQHFLVDIDSTQTCLDEPLTIDEYHYGGMGVRGQRQWFDAQAGDRGKPDPARRGEFEFTTSEGKNRLAGNHTRPEWVSLSGKIDGQPATLTVMGHPTNFRFPQPVRLHPTKPYFCFAPMVLGEFQLEKSRPYVSRYRFLVYDGSLDPNLNRAVWSDYAEPPQVRVVAANTSR